MAFQCSVDGIPVLKISKPRGPTYYYNRPTKLSFGDQPLVQDPLDKKYVNLKKSRAFPNATANEGAFAKMDIPSNIICSLYGGLILTKDEDNALSKEIFQSRDEKWIEKRNMYR